MSDWAEKAELRCRHCGHKLVVVNTRGRSARNVIYRQRKCAACAQLVTTYETFVDPDLALRGLTAARQQLLEAVDLARKVLMELPRE